MSNSLSALDLIQNYSKDRLIILREFHQSAVSLYQSGRLTQALVSFNFILKECDSLMGVLPSSSVDGFAFFIIDVNQFRNECVEQLSKAI